MCGKGFGSEGEFLEDLAAAENSNWCKKGIDALVCRRHKTVEVGDCAEK